jgi:hypothetical protein
MYILLYTVDLPSRTVRAESVELKNNGQLTSQNVD